MNEPPGREVVDRGVVDGGDAVGDGELHAARSMVASTAATPPAVWRNRRRSIPTSRAASSARARALASIARSCCVGESGTYSPFVAGVTPSGRRTSPSGSSSRRRGTRPTIRPATPRRVRVGTWTRRKTNSKGGTSDVRLRLPLAHSARPPISRSPEEGHAMERDCSSPTCSTPRRDPTTQRDARDRPAAGVRRHPGRGILGRAKWVVCFRVLSSSGFPQRVRGPGRLGVDRGEASPFRRSSAARCTANAVSLLWACRSVGSGTMPSSNSPTEPNSLVPASLPRAERLTQSPGARP